MIKNKSLFISRGKTMKGFSDGLKNNEGHGDYDLANRAARYYIENIVKKVDLRTNSREIWKKLSK